MDKNKKNITAALKVTKVDSNGWFGGFLQGMKKLDGWMNIISGIGTKNRDANTASKVSWEPMSELEIENFYAGEALAEKIVDMPADDALSSGYKIMGVKPDEEKRILERNKQLKGDFKILEAAKKARLYGGALMLKVYNDNLNLTAPVTGLLAKAKQPLKTLVVLSRFEAYANYEDVNKDILSPNFGMPEYYNLYSRVDSLRSTYGIKIHRSRTLRFEGKKLPDHFFRSNNYWGDSVLTKLQEPIRNYAMSHSSVANALSDLSVAVYKIKGLADMMAANCEDDIARRMTIINLSKSIARAVVVDAEGEDFEFKNRSMAGVKELVDASEHRLTASSGMPHTVLLGNSPTGGLGQSGNHEERNWNKWIANYQESYIKEPHLALLKEIAEELGINTANMDIQYHPPSEPSESEEVATRKTQAEVDNLYVDMGVLDVEEVRTSRFGGEKYSIDTTIDANLDPKDIKETTEVDPTFNPFEA